ncbi:MAG: DoxX family protein, partial [Micrococcaceae bacterium]|nr:DoxX family protein [Micrococcaceae bacterium]
MSLARLIARPLLASSFVLTGLDRVRKPEESGERLRPNLRRAASVFPQLESVAAKPALAARCIGAAQVLSGLMLALGKLPRFSAFVLVGYSAVPGFNDNAGASKLLTGSRGK